MQSGATGLEPPWRRMSNLEGRTMRMVPIEAVWLLVLGALGLPVVFAVGMLMLLRARPEATLTEASKALARCLRLRGPTGSP